MTGSPLRAVRPSAELSVGTLRQPSSRWPSSATMRANRSSICARWDRVARQEHHAGAVLARRRQVDAEAARLLAKNRCGNCNSTPAPSPVFVSQPHAPRWRRLMTISKRLLHDTVRAAALDVDDEPDAARIVLLARVVQPLSSRLECAHAIRPLGRAGRALRPRRRPLRRSAAQPGRGLRRRALDRPLRVFAGAQQLDEFHDRRIQAALPAVDDAERPDRQRAAGRQAEGHADQRAPAHLLAYGVRRQESRCPRRPPPPA